MRPAFVVQSGLGQLMPERNYWFHLQGFLKGSVGISVVTLLLAGLIMLGMTL
ncbi:MAG: hypothetical protein R3E79_48800 [Caldilineaceae bacterium]